MIYADSSLIAALLLRDSNSEQSIAMVEKAGEPLAMNLLLELEVGNAIQLCRKANRLSENGSEAAKKQFRVMRGSGFFKLQKLDWERVFLRSKGLSEAQTASCGTRSLDILHVASAIEGGADRFWTFDKRQRSLAEKTGLKLNQ